MTDHLRNTLLCLCRNDGVRFAFACRRLFIRLGDDIGAQAMISGGDDFLSADPCEHDPSTSLLVCRFGRALTFDLVVERVAPRFLGLAVESRGLVPDEVARFAEVLDAALERSAQVIGELPPAVASAIIEVDWCRLDEVVSLPDAITRSRSRRPCAGKGVLTKDRAPRSESHPSRRPIDADAVSGCAGHQLRRNLDEERLEQCLEICAHRQLRNHRLTHLPERPRSASL